MHYRRLGTSGCRVSVVSLGSWLTYGTSLDAETTAACVRTAFESGVNLFDTADAYGHGAAEEALARALTPFRRQDYVLATKTFFPMSEGVNDRGLSRKHIMESCHASLRRLGTDHLDLYQCHRHDPDTPVEEVARAMADLIRQGKVLYWGTSLWPAARIVEACAVADRTLGYRPVTNQPQYNLLERGVEAEVMPVCRELGIAQIVYCPLAQGLLTGKYGGGKVPGGTRAADERTGKFLRPRMTEERIALADRIALLARERGLAPAQLALAWILRRPEVASAIVGATHPAQVAENAQAADVTLDETTRATLDAWTEGAAA